MGEEGKSIETGEPGSEEGMFGGKPVLVAFIKAPRERRREDEDQTGA